LREYRTLKVISNNDILPQEQRSAVLNKVIIIESAMDTLTEKEI